MRWIILSFGLMFASCVRGHWDCPSEKADALAQFVTEYQKGRSGGWLDECMYSGQEIFCKWVPGRNK